MTDNGTATPGVDSASDDNEARVALVALGISLVALLLTLVQSLLAFLQFDNSEGRGRRLPQEVMGPLWMSRTTRKYKWRQFRFQVYFEVPLLYTAPPWLTVGPLVLPKTDNRRHIWKRLQAVFYKAPEPIQFLEEDTYAALMEVIKPGPCIAPIYKITGTESSYRHTLTEYSYHGDENWSVMSLPAEEGCSWVQLLSAMQGQERTSRKWDLGECKVTGDYRMCYMMQRMTRCWDFMPLNITKPYATTTVCHLVEMMVMLGLIWSKLDIDAGTLSAEGNGFMVRSEKIFGLGILIRFIRIGKPVHEADRVIPNPVLKRLCFGEVPSLFDDTGIKLQFGSRLEAHNSLRRLLPELGSRNIDLLLSHTRSSPATAIITHLFQLIAMVATSAHILGSQLRRLPNPCFHPPSQTLDAAAGLLAFWSGLKDCQDLGTHFLTQEINRFFENGQPRGDNEHGVTNCGNLERLIENYVAADAVVRQQLHGRWIAAGDKESAKTQRANALVTLLNILYETVCHIDEIFVHLEEVVREVITLHFSAVFERDKTEEGAVIVGGNWSEENMVSFYFGQIHPAIIGQSGASYSPQHRELTPKETERSGVWLALMFRMWAWLFLHDFNPVDIMFDRKEHMDSRLPVYIG